MKAVLATIICRIPFCLLLVLLISKPAMAQFQGRIFTTPDERVYLDALREDFLAKSREQGFDIDEALPPPLPKADEAPAKTGAIEYTLGGILTRNDGSQTVWLNNRPVAEADLPANMRLIADGQLAVLRIETTAGTFQLKPGQTLNASTGEILEAYQRVVPPTNGATASAAANDAESASPSDQTAPAATETMSDSVLPQTATEADAREAP